MTAQINAKGAWSSLVALGIVATLSIATVCADLLLDSQTADRTSQLVDNSLRSVALADDLRYQAYRLTNGARDAATLSSIAKQIDVDARAYDPIATDVGELAEWTRLQSLLAHLQHEPATAPLIADIERSISRLVAINEAGARDAVRAIHDAHTRGLWIDTMIGIATIALAIVIATTLMRSLRRQRTLLQLHLGSLAERNRELDEFAARTAHDLKGPLSPIFGYADVLLMNDAAPVRETATRIRRSAERLNGIIDDLLALSTSGKPRPGAARVDIVAREVIEELRASLADADVRIEVETAIVACSHGVLRQVLHNLVSNAIKYRASRRLQIAVTSRRDRDRFELAITDNGRGMTAAQAAQAFEPFYRAIDDVPGHGLGLAIVKRTIVAIGGSCELSSTAGRGTRVTLRLPVALP